jgi:hypothetical protein
MHDALPTLRRFLLPYGDFPMTTCYIQTRRLALIMIKTLEVLISRRFLMVKFGATPAWRSGICAPAAGREEKAAAATKTLYGYSADG